MVAPAVSAVLSFIARSGLAAAVKKFGKQIVDNAIEAGKKTTTTSNKTGRVISDFTKQGTGSQTVTRNVARESIKRGAAGGAAGTVAVGAGVAAALSSDDKKKDKTPKGVRFNKVTDADVARVRAKTEEAKAKQSGPATVTVKKGDTLSEIAKANDMSVAQIKAINDIKNVNEIKPGQKIKLKTKDPYENKMSKGGKATKKKK